MQTTQTLVKRYVNPLLIAFINLSGVLLVALLIEEFNWRNLALTLVNFIFPAYGFFIGARKIVETRVMLHGILVTLVLTCVYASVAASDQLVGSLYFLVITWLHIAAVVLLTKYLTRVTLAKTTLKVGNRLPDFVFDDHKGNPITRSVIGDGPILFYFFRGNWCPFCSVQVEALIREYKNIQAEGIHLAFVSTESHEEMQKLAEKHDLACHYLIDIDFKFAKQYNLINRQAVPAPVGRGTDTLYPTLLLLDQRNKVLMLEQTDDDRLRPEPDVVLEKVKSLGANAYLEEVIEKRTAELHKEKEKSEKIILNILPEHTAIELKEKGSTQARYYEQVPYFSLILWVSPALPRVLNSNYWSTLSILTSRNMIVLHTNWV